MTATLEPELIPDPLLTHGEKYRTAHTEAAQIIAILERCHAEGCKSMFEQTYDMEQHILAFDEDRAYKALTKPERSLLMRCKIPLGMICETDRTWVYQYVRQMRRKDADNPYRGMVSPLLYRKICNYPIDGKPCGRALEQHADGVNGVICDKCEMIQNEKEKKDKQQDYRMRWLEITPPEFQARFDTNYPLLSPNARNCAAIHAGKVKAWAAAKAWNQIGGWLWLGNDENGVKTGVTGSGKSHLSSRAQLAAMMDGLTGYRVTAGTWNDATKKNLPYASAQWAEDVKKLCLTAECLVFDEAGEVGIADDLAPVKAFFDLIRERTERHLCTIVNSQGGPDYLMQQFGRWDENKSRVSAMVRRLEENSRI